MKAISIKTEEYFLHEEPFYLPIGKEIELMESAYNNQIPVLLKGPTGCGKTRFVQYMAWRLKRPLITVSCHDDLTASDLVGRYLLKAGETVWIDGPLSKAVKVGGFCYLDEIVEARKDTIAVIHPIADDRRLLPVEKKGEIIKAPPEFFMIISFNPGYQSVLKDLKQSTRQRFIAIEFAYPKKDMEIQIIVHESGLDMETAAKLVSFAEKTRNLKDRGLIEGASTRLLIHAAKLIKNGIGKNEACTTAVSQVLTDDREMLIALNEILSSIF